MWFEYLFSLITLYLLVAVAAAIHVLLHKRNSRAAWVHRKARRIAGDLAEEEPLPSIQPAVGALLSRPGLSVTGRALVDGNSVVTYFNGEQAFPAMLDAIDEAASEVLLSTYIFDRDETGLRFVERLKSARERGCRVCVLLDDVGIRYSLPTVIGALKKAGIEFRRFMPLRLLPPSFSINLRTHRKLLIADRKVVFAGGMNIGDRQLVDGPSPHRASDLHFRFSGPLTRDCVELFAEDWKFSRGSDMGQLGQACPPGGAARCRLVSDGPDETLDSLILVIMGAVSSARRRVWIMSPYFLPERQMLGCLQAAALSGVDVQVMIPEKNNWPLVQWALQHNMHELLQAGVKILQRPPPFAHSKCLLVDDDYALVGSSNLDPRSLRLNFELGIEVFDPELNHELSRHFEGLLPSCRVFDASRLNSRNTLARLRDGFSALFSPYL
jgi:cardiolipin synthase